MTMKKPTYVAVIDDDISLRESLPDLLRELGHEAKGFSSVVDFLEDDEVRPAQCLLLDIAMPGISGLDLQRELKRRGRTVPIIFITTQGEGPVHLRVHGRGAISYLTRPFSDTALLEALQAAFEL